MYLSNTLLYIVLIFLIVNLNLVECLLDPLSFTIYGGSILAILPTIKYAYDKTKCQFLECCVSEYDSTNFNG